LKRYLIKIIIYNQDLSFSILFKKKKKKKQKKKNKKEKKKKNLKNFKKFKFFLKIFLILIKKNYKIFI